MIKEIEIPVWYSTGGMMYRRDCLPITHPEHPYNYIKNTLGLIPESYGVFHPVLEKYKGMTKKQLLSVVCSLEQELNLMGSQVW